MTTGRPADHRVVLVCVLVYAAAASLTRPLTVPAAVAVAAPAVAGLVVATLRDGAAQHAGIDPAVRRTAALWAAVVALGTAWELAAWLQQPAYNVASSEHPTASVLFDPVTGAGVPRFAVWCCWVYLGWRMVRR